MNPTIEMYVVFGAVAVLAAAAIYAAVKRQPESEPTRQIANDLPVAGVRPGAPAIEPTPMCAATPAALTAGGVFWAVFWALWVFSTTAGILVFLFRLVTGGV